MVCRDLGWSEDWHLLDTEGETSMLEARGFAFAGLQDFFVGGNVGHANILAVLLGCITERQIYMESRGQRKKQIIGRKNLVWGRPDCLREVKNH